MSRTFVIGDIHGALKALEQVIDLIAPQQDDSIIFLGDYVDGWPESAQVIEYLLSLTCNCVFLKGNHDLLCEQWLIGGTTPLEWHNDKGLATIESYAGFDEKTKSHHLQFFSQLKNFYVDAQNRLFLHAGFTNNNGPQFEVPQYNLLKDRSLFDLALTMDKRVASHPDLFPKRLRLFKEIYIGHTPTLIYDSFVPIRACNVINMDTGAGFYGRLSAMNIDSYEILQSDVVKDLYPKNKGRNKD